MSLLFGHLDVAQPDPISGSSYISKLHKFLKSNVSRLAPPATRSVTPSFWQQSYTLLTLGLDPNSAPLSQSIKVPLTLGFGQSPPVQRRAPPKPLLLRLPIDRLLYLLLRWQALPQSLPHVGRTDTPVSDEVVVTARGAYGDNSKGKEGDVESVRSWVGSIQNVSGSLASSAVSGSWWSKGKTYDEDELLLSLYSMFTLLPGLLIRPSNVSEPPIAELAEAGGYTPLGGIDVRVPLDVLRNLQILELENYDPRALLIPVNPGLRSLTIRQVQDGDDWVHELLVSTPLASVESEQEARFPNLHHLCLIDTSLLSFPDLPLTSLTHLDLSHNLLDSIPSSLSALSNLTSLNLSHNVITSLRNAPSCLKSLVSVNLSFNRVDCLVGLDRVIGLERVDVRSNELYDAGEVGRLALLPYIREIYCTGNPFENQHIPEGTEHWRIILGRMFKEEGRDVVLDGVVWTWNEERRIEAGLASRGRRKHTVTWSQPQDHELSQPLSPEPDINHSTLHSHLIETGTIAALESPSKSSKGRKKGRRRVIDLDNQEEREQEIVGEAGPEQVYEGKTTDDDAKNDESQDTFCGKGNGKEGAESDTFITAIKKNKSKKARELSTEPLPP
ncbi:uncharacterized protein L203_102848 [Cryptococcus depauperatus CBS 7841]|uniref:Uncharacterized protein n=1 Tax=Cryptococcus depauperatus CBS 7841 TaxID=1295531 RepID=A0A1E3IAY8_9TREE|nr:hypothetical protein L203_04650 [Cryptococcus depauperatus CBS 7841]